MQTPSTPLTPPLISVVTVTASDFANMRRTLRHLRAQTIADQIELILVAPSNEAIADREPDELKGFARTEIIAVGPIDNVDHAAADGIHRATAPVVALVEDHAYPEPGWAAAMVEAHQGPWAAVGSTMVNANPQNSLSWINLLIAYGPWTDKMQKSGSAVADKVIEVDALPGHNISYKRDVLVEYGDALVNALGRSGELPNALTKRGHRFALATGARLAHANPSLLSSTADLRFSAGRLYGAKRAEAGGWSPVQRALYTLGGPLIPLVRFRRLRQELFGDGQRREIAGRVQPALLLGLVLDGLGQMAGYAAGPGSTPDKLATFEMDRPQHLTRRDQESLRE